LLEGSINNKNLDKNKWDRCVG